MKQAFEQENNHLQQAKQAVEEENDLFEQAKKFLKNRMTICSK
jgi:hypothetical protein